MTVETEIAAALRAVPALAAAVHQDVFPQPPAVPKWPAVRFTKVSGTPYLDMCGDGGEDTDDVRFQIDVVSSKSADERNDLARQVRAALSAAWFLPQGSTTNEYDAETKTYRGTIDVISHRESQ